MEDPCRHRSRRSPGGRLASKAPTMSTTVTMAQDTASAAAAAAPTATPAAPTAAAPAKAGAPSRSASSPWESSPSSPRAGWPTGAHSRHFEETDDAQIDGNISNVSPRVSGNVSAVVRRREPDGQGGRRPGRESTRRPARSPSTRRKPQVAQAAGPARGRGPVASPSPRRRTRAPCVSAQSDLPARARRSRRRRKDVEQLTAQLAQAQANDRTAQLEKERSEKLVAQGAVAQSDYDLRLNAAAGVGSQHVDALSSRSRRRADRVAQQQALIGTLQSHFAEVKSNAPRQIATRKASVVLPAGRRSTLANAQLAQAQRNLVRQDCLARDRHRRQEIDRRRRPRRAGPAGRRHRADRRALGDRQLPRDAARTDDAGTAGRPSTSTRSTLDLHGSVESIGGATGSRLSVLPPENASGNYVKVVQRIPVRIKLDPGPAGPRSPPHRHERRAAGHGAMSARRGAAARRAAAARLLRHRAGRAGTTRGPSPSSSRWRRSWRCSTRASPTCRCPTSRATCRVSQDESTWVLTSYLVSNAIVLPISGWISTQASGASAST